ncbi:MAG: glycoside hydrolase family 88 protein [Proteobacteria bacterium]|nr:glycoside hydrolase family 88 protein [Pseudomonadota bacterium]
MHRILPLILLCACTPDPELHDTLATADLVAARGIDNWSPDALGLGWIPTVWGHGLIRYDVVKEGTAGLDYNEGWMADVVPAFSGTDPKRFTASDELALASVASWVHDKRPEAALEPILTAAETYLADAPTTDEGAIEHWTGATATQEPYVDQIWVDSQFMFGMVWLLEFDRTADSALLDKTAEQYLLFSQLLRDEGDQLYLHAYDDVDDVNIPADAVYWARGNSWVLISGVELLARMPEDHADRAEVLGLVQTHADAIIASQADDGLWHTVMNQPIAEDPDNYTETSGAALLLYGLARGVREGVLDAEATGPAIDAAVVGMLDRIKDTGEVEDTSYGTNPGDYDNYVGIGTADDLMLGVGAVLMALSDVHGLEKTP